MAQIGSKKREGDTLQDALELIERWSKTASDDEIKTVKNRLSYLQRGENYPQFSRHYPADFRSDDVYKATLPDIQNGPTELIKGATQYIQHVGISNFRLPIRFRIQNGDAICLETSVTGTVSLDANKKGINMSRIMRSFYRNAEKTFSFRVIEDTLDAYKRDLGSFDARIQMRFSYPMKVKSLRSGLEGYQYYDIALEVVDQDGQRSEIMHLDYVYSSTCPCSLELSEHARQFRGQLATPHSQRSVARISVELDQSAKCLWFEDLIMLCKAAVPTETQVMVKREDEQAFAELNAAHPIFVEDAARLFCASLKKDPRIRDFRVIVSHQESLHSHDAVSILSEGEIFAAISIDPKLFSTL